MLLHDLLSSQLCGLGHGNRLGAPGRRDHPGLTFFLGTHSTVDHIPHRIDHADPHFCGVVRGDLHSFLRHEFRLAGHNGLTGAALGQFIPGPFLPVGILNVGDHQLFHYAFDKGRFAGSNRTNDANIDVSTGSCSDISINSFHSQPPCAFTTQYVRKKILELLLIN